MAKELMCQEDLEDTCPLMVEELNLYIAESDTFKDAEEATIYALVQLIHNKLESIDFELEEKGAIVSTLIQGLIEFNEPSLAAHKELMRSITEQKASTIH